MSAGAPFVVLARPFEDPEDALVFVQLVQECPHVLEVAASEVTDNGIILELSVDSESDAVDEILKVCAGHVVQSERIQGGLNLTLTPEPLLGPASQPATWIPPPVAPRERV